MEHSNISIKKLNLIEEPSIEEPPAESTETQT